jgi:hypothetical protein
MIGIRCSAGVFNSLFALPNCGQPLPEMSAGVRLNPIKARIFDAVKISGNEGVPTSALIDQTYNGHGIKPRRPHSIKSHIHQINELLDDTGMRIVSSKGRYPVWMLVHQ